MKPQSPPPRATPKERKGLVKLKSQEIDAVVAKLQWPTGDPLTRIAAMKNLQDLIEREWVLAGLSGMRFMDEKEIVERAKQALIRQTGNADEATTAAEDLEVDKMAANRKAAEEQLNEIGKTPAVKTREAAFEARELLNNRFPQGLSKKAVAKALEFLSNNQRSHCASTILAKFDALRYVQAKTRYAEIRPGMSHSEAWALVNQEIKETFKGRLPISWEGLAFDRWLSQKTQKLCLLQDVLRGANVSIVSSTGSPAMPTNISGLPLGTIIQLEAVDGYGLAPVHCSGILGRLEDLENKLTSGPAKDDLLDTKALNNFKKVSAAIAEAAIPLQKIDFNGVKAKDFEQFFANKMTSAIGQLDQISRLPIPVTDGHDLLLNYYSALVVFETSSMKVRAPSRNYTSQTWEDAQCLGQSGLYLAATRYDPNTGFPFTNLGRLIVRERIKGQITTDNLRSTHEQNQINNAHRAANGIITGLSEGALARAEKAMRRGKDSIDIEDEEGKEAILSRLPNTRFAQPDRAAMIREAKQIVQNAFFAAKLTEQEKQIFVLSFAEDLTNLEIAIAMGVSDPYVRQQLLKVGAKLHDAIQEFFSTENGGTSLNKQFGLAMALLGLVPAPKNAIDRSSSTTSKIKTKE